MLAPVGAVKLQRVLRRMPLASRGQVFNETSIGKPFAEGEAMSV